MVKAVALLPDPTMGPDRWTQRSFELRNLATLTGRCRVCPGRPRFAGVDHREIRHTAFRHAAGCRCSDDRIAAHLRHRGLTIEAERHLVYVVDLASGHWARAGVAA